MEINLMFKYSDTVGLNRKRERERDYPFDQIEAAALLCFQDNVKKD